MVTVKRLNSPMGHGCYSKRQMLTRSRAVAKYTFLRTYIWRLDSWLNNERLRHGIDPTTLDLGPVKVQYMNVYVEQIELVTPDELKKLEEAHRLMTEVFERLNYNNNTQILINKYK